MDERKHVPIVPRFPPKWHRTCAVVQQKVAQEEGLQSKSGAEAQAILLLGGGQSAKEASISATNVYRWAAQAEAAEGPRADDAEMVKLLVRKV